MLEYGQKKEVLLLMNDSERYNLISKNPWLIQSGYFKKGVANLKDEDINGIDDILNFNLMGSAEFDFGALPHSLCRMTINGDFYQVYTITKYHDKVGNPLKIYAPIIYKDKIIEYVAGLIENKYFLQESCYLRAYIEKGIKKGNEFWWDVENDYFIFFKHTDKILKAMEAFKKRHYGYPQNDFKIAYSSKKHLEFKQMVSNYQLSIADYRSDSKNQIHFLKFSKYYSFLRILMDAFLIARVNKGEVRFNYNGFNFKINENTTLDDITKEYGINLEDYCFSSSNIEDLINEQEEEANLRQRLVNTLSLIRK